jgi:hypothetical protein
MSCSGMMLGNVPYACEMEYSLQYVVDRRRIRSRLDTSSGVCRIVILRNANARLISVCQNGRAKGVRYGQGRGVARIVAI